VGAFGAVALHHAGPVAAGSGGGCAGAGFAWAGSLLPERLSGAAVFGGVGGLRL